MQRLSLPEYEFSITNTQPAKIFDFIRKKYVVLTPEEWVRQNFLKYLVEEKKYPPTLIHIEKILALHKMQKRCDALVYNNKAEPLMLLEFKAPEVHISQKVFDQIARYNMALQVKYLIVSNGYNHYCCKIDFITRSYEFLEVIPEYTLL